MNRKTMTSTDQQPTTGQKCGCRPGIWRDNCTQCEGTGWAIDFRAIRARSAEARQNWGSATHIEIADTLKRVLGMEEAIRYADKIARMSGPLTVAYFNALSLLRQWKADA